VENWTHFVLPDFEYGTAILMMQHNTFIEFLCGATKQTKPIRKVLINAVGFGGNAVSVTVALVLLPCHKSSCFQTL
jgi:hypothetical protein